MKKSLRSPRIQSQPPCLWSPGLGAQGGVCQGGVCQGGVYPQLYDCVKHTYMSCVQTCEGWVEEHHLRLAGAHYLLSSVRVGHKQTKEERETISKEKSQTNVNINKQKGTKTQQMDLKGRKINIINLHKVTTNTAEGKDFLTSYCPRSEPRH